MREPPYGQRPMVTIIDKIAKNNPTRPWIYVPRSSSPADGWKPITYSDGANAINRIAHMMVGSMGSPAAGSWPTVAYIGPNDMRYIIFMFGAIKAGYKVLSPRISYPYFTQGPDARCDYRLCRHCSSRHGTLARDR